MIIVSWNVNGLRAVLKNSEKTLKCFLDELEADIICLQETKATKSQLDRSSCIADGYTSFFSFCKVKGGYSGVVTFCRQSVTPLRAEEGLTGVLTAPNEGVEPIGDVHAHFISKDDMLAFDGEGRVVITEHMCDKGDGVSGEVGGVMVEQDKERVQSSSLVVINIYCPMVDRENINTERLQYKMVFYSVLQDRCNALQRAGKLVIVAGDLNCSREAIDSAYIQDTPSLLHGSPEREWMKGFVSSTPPTAPPTTPNHHLLDTYRYLHPTQRETYTCWSTFLGYRKTNYGTRIDYILCSSQLISSLSRAEVWSHVMGSDHCPIMADFSSLSLTPASSEPSLSLHIQLGRQTTLSSFIKPLVGQTSPEVKVHNSVAKGNSVKCVKGVKRKLSGATSSLPATKHHKTLDNFFINPSSTRTSISSETGSDVITDHTPTSSQLSSEWSIVFSGPPKPPMCKKHNEPTTLRTVKKTGPTRGQQFWICSRHAGSKNDPNTQCDFFQWLTMTSSHGHGKHKIT